MSFFVGQKGFRSLKSTVLVGSLVVSAAGMLAQAPAPSQSNSKTVPDAQVEANVMRQLATAPDLSTQDVQSTTVYGTVTLTGTVQTEALRTKAENLAARADGVKKVVDELSLGTPAVANATPGSAPGGDPQAAQAQQANGGQPDGTGTYPPQGGDPAQANMANPPANNQAYNNQPPAYNNQYPNQPPPNGQQQAYGQPYGQPNQPQPTQPQQGYPQQSYGQAPPPNRQPMYNGYAADPNAPPPPGAGQQAGLQVVVPSGAMLQVRINRGIDSNHIAPGTPFSGIVMNDVVAGGAVAIPRGASIQGTVVDAKKAGALKGQGELGLALTGLTLGGQTYQIASVPWDREGRDKTVSTVNSALGLGALGAIFGGVAGGGAGAAIGAAAGGAVGVAGAASTPGGRVIVPPESILTFHLAQPASVVTVSQQEMARLSYAAGPAPAPAGPPRRRYYSPYYGYYYAPAPYGRPY